MIIYNYKILISIVSGMIWIYYRDDLCYKLIPKNNLLVSVCIGLWIYINYYEPLVLPFGLIILYFYSIKFRKK